MIIFQAGKFGSAVGTEGFMLSVLCAGSSPVMSMYKLLHQVTLMGLFRFVSTFHFNSFFQIISNCLEKKKKKRKIKQTRKEIGCSNGRDKKCCSILDKRMKTKQVMKSYKCLSFFFLQTCK